MPTKRPASDLGCSLSGVLKSIRNRPTGSGVLPEHTVSIPMSKVAPPKRPLVEVENEPMASLLTERGVAWPLNGYAPGHYVGQSCSVCGKRHEADKRAMSCLACALTLVIGAAADHPNRYDEGVAEGRRRATADVSRALGIVEAPAAALGLVRERIEGPLNAPAYAVETLELAIREIDGWIRGRP